MKLLAIIFLFIFGSNHVFATSQARDILCINGEEYYLESFPLEDFFKINKEKRPKSSDFISTGLYRGYIATFEIIDNQIFVKDIEQLLHDKKNNISYFKSILNEIFPIFNERKTEWYSGLLIVGFGNIIEEESLFDNVYEKYRVFEVKNGNITNVKYYTLSEYEIFKHEQYLRLHNL